MKNPIFRATVFCFCLGLLTTVAITANPALAQTKKKANATAKTQTKQDFSNPVIAVLDVQNVLREAKAAKHIRTIVEGRRKKFDAVIGKERKALAKAQEALRKQQAVLKRETFAKRRQELERKYGDLKRKVDGYRRVLTAAFASSQRKLRFEMAKILAGIMKKRNINITLARTGVLVFDERLNVTKEVITALDKKLPKVPVKFGKLK